MILDGALTRRGARALVALVFLVVFNGVLVWDAAWPNLYDADSYYHLAVSRAYAEEGNLHGLPWARFSILNEGFGDKEVTFHLFLAPLASMKDPLLGGKIAVALLNAAVAATVAFLAIEAIGAWGVLVPFWLFATAADFTLRTLRLRPEIVSLLLFLAAAFFAARKRYLFLALVGLLYPLSYTAFHVFLALCFAFFVYVAWAERRWDWRLLGAAFGGVLVGVLVHPQFPANVKFFWIVAWDYFRYKAVLDVGPEIQPSSTLDVVALNAGWIFGMVVLAASGKRLRAASDERAIETRRLADFLLIGSVGFLGLYMAMMRFSTYFIPFATLALLFRISLEGGIGRTRLPWRGGVPFAAAFGAAFLFAPYAYALIHVNLENAGVYLPGRRENDAALGRLLPKGARVAAPWYNAETYILAAPQARYLNLLDPVLMAVPFPKVYAAQRALFRGKDPDPPLTAFTTLDSEYLLFGSIPDHARLSERLANDPRAERLHSGPDFLYRIRGGANRSFVLDWRVAPRGSMPPTPQGAAAAWPAYPRASAEAARAVEGYVDARRISSDSCVTFVHAETLAAPALVSYELAASGPTTLFLDGQWIASTQAGSEAVLGRGLALPLKLAAGTHEITVGTCPADRQNGFYLVERTRTP